MDWVIAGESTKEIAEALRLSPRTVEIHRANAMRKMGARSSVELVRMASLCRKIRGNPLTP